MADTQCLHCAVPTDETTQISPVCKFQIRGLLARVRQIMRNCVNKVHDESDPNTNSALVMSGERPIIWKYLFILHLLGVFSTAIILGTPALIWASRLLFCQEVNEQKIGFCKTFGFEELVPLVIGLVLAAFSALGVWFLWMAILRFSDGRVFGWVITCFKACSCYLCIFMSMIILCAHGGDDFDAKIFKLIIISVLVGILGLSCWISSEGRDKVLPHVKFASQQYNISVKIAAKEMSKENIEKCCFLFIGVIALWTLTWAVALVGMDSNFGQSHVVDVKTGTEYPMEQCFTELTPEDEQEDKCWCKNMQGTITLVENGEYEHLRCFNPRAPEHFFGLKNLILVCIMFWSVGVVANVAGYAISARVLYSKSPNLDQTLRPAMTVHFGSICFSSLFETPFNFIHTFVIPTLERCQFPGAWLDQVSHFTESFNQFSLSYLSMQNSPNYLHAGREAAALVASHGLTNAPQGNSAGGSLWNVAISKISSVVVGWVVGFLLGLYAESMGVRYGKSLLVYTGWLIGYKTGTACQRALDVAVVAMYLRLAMDSESFQEEHPEEHAALDTAWKLLDCGISPLTSPLLGSGNGDNPVDDVCVVSLFDLTTQQGEIV